jgi:hypothetical protein
MLIKHTQLLLPGCSTFLHVSNALCRILTTAIVHVSAARILLSIMEIQFQILRVWYVL